MKYLFIPNSEFKRFIELLHTLNNVHLAIVLGFLTGRKLPKLCRGKRGGIM